MSWMTIIVIGLSIWFIPGFLAYGLSIGYWNAHPHFGYDKETARFLFLFGPIGLFLELVAWADSEEPIHFSLRMSSEQKRRQGVH